MSTHTKSGILKKRIGRNYEHVEIQKRVKHHVHKDKSKVIPRLKKYKDDDKC